MSAMSGKPEGFQVFPLEPRVQGRFARIVMAEDPFHSTPAPYARASSFLRLPLTIAR